MGRRVKDEGGSEGRPVMGRIGVETSLPRKRADFPRVLTTVNRQPTGFRGQSRSVGGIVTILAGAALADLGSRPCRSNVQVDPKANGATASRKGCRGPAELRPVVSRRGVVQCLSCMRRKVPVQF